MVRLVIQHGFGRPEAVLISLQADLARHRERALWPGRPGPGRALGRPRGGARGGGPRLSRRPCAAACGPWRSSRERRRLPDQLPPGLPLVRAGHRAERRLHRDPAGRHRAAGPQRGGQVHLPQAGGGAASAQPGRGAPPGVAGLGLAGAVLPGGAVPGDRRLLGAPDRPRVPDDAPAPHRVRRGRVPAPGRERPRAGPAPGRPEPEAGRLQQGHAPADQAGPVGGPRPRGAAPRRAGGGHGPRESPAGDRPGPAPRARRARRSSSPATSSTRWRR